MGPVWNMTDLMPPGASMWHLFDSPICHTSHNTGTICSLYNFGKYNIFQRPDETMLFVMVRACLHLEIFPCFRSFDCFVPLIIINKQNKNLHLHVDSCFFRKMKVLQNVLKMIVCHVFTKERCSGEFYMSTNSVYP